MSDVKIWNRNGFVAGDPWQVVGPQDELPPEGDVLVPLERFFALSEEVRGSVGSAAGGNVRRIGIVIAPDDDPASIADLLGDIALVAVDFPKYSDGRAFSHAAMLREHYRYTGEIRAVGDVLIDQIPLMLRVGIDSFAVENEVALKRLAEGRLNGIAQHYQPTALPAQKSGTYAWRRVGA